MICLGLDIKAQDLVLIKNVDVWDGESNELMMDYNVLVEDNLIKSIGKNISIPDSIQIIDGNGGTLIPGLSDAHVHLDATGQNFLFDNAEYWALRSAKAAENFLMCGFTTVRNLGGQVFGLKRAIDEDLFPGPRIYPSGPIISQTSGHGDYLPIWADYNSFSVHDVSIVDGVPEVLKAVRKNLKQGATQIKVMAGGGISTDYDPIHSVQFTPDELRAAVQAAMDWDTYVAVHAYTPDAIIRALEAGVKCIEHGQRINEEAMILLKKKDAWLVPQSKWSLAPERDWSKVPKDRIDNMKKKDYVTKGINNEMELAIKHKVNLAFGTDQYGKLGTEHKALDEFTSRIRWFTPLEVLRQATSINAKLFSLSGKLNPYTDGQLGLIKEGAYADILIYEGNPLKDISVIVNYIDNLKFIMKDGKIYKNEL